MDFLGWWTNVPRELAAALLFIMSTILLLWKQWSAGCASAECGQTVGKRQLVHGLSTRFVGRLHGFNAWWRGDLNLTGLFLTRQISNNLRNPFILHPK